MRLEIPGREVLVVEHLILDYNGTIALNGEVYEGVLERLAVLADSVMIHVLTADTYGSVHAQCSGAPVSVHVIGREVQDREKLSFIESLNPSLCVAIGNGRNDALMLETAVLGFAVIQEEGTSMKALASCDVAFRSIHDALDALIHPQRLIATLRN